MILQGNIAEAILDYAKKGNFDLIVAGAKGRGVLEGLLMGSVTRKLVSLSRIPIFVVKEWIVADKIGILMKGPA